MKEKRFRYLLLLPSLLACLGLDVITPVLADDEQVQEADATTVAGCAFLGSVQGGSIWGSRSQAKKDALGDAAKLGATHLVWDNVEGVWGWTVATANGKAYNCNKRQENTASTDPTVATNSSPAIISICAGTPIPDGYIKMNDEWSPTRCGNPAIVNYNVWSLIKYVDLSPGKTLEVCADSATPSGFVITDTQWNPTRCGYPKDRTENIKVIQRIP